MTQLFILDTDHITLYQRGDPQVTGHVTRTPRDLVATSIVTYEEQLRGRLAVVRQAQTAERLALAYQRLHEMHAFFCAIRLVDFDPSTAKIYEALRKEYRRLGKMDLRIAATVLANDGVLVTRNQSDFGQIADLSTEDWST
ncbi:MAG: type II toxin-antitoxin system VapC family toxin [Anaerolineae bacterium]|nr:type II toxin-antitoxin system VapC family toxin [Anaerolineae bacterium]